MKSHNKLFIFCILVSLAASASVGFAQQAATAPEKSASVENANKPTTPLCPYLAQITDDEVNIRSGPGTNYYSCGKLNESKLVKKVADKFSWSQIVPPKGSFSWISKQYLAIDPNNPSVGTVTGDSVRVWAGSPDLKPIHSTRLQVKLNKGEKVSLMGEEQGGYYKIVPPPGAYLWVSTKFTKPIRPQGKVPLVAKPKTEAKPETKPVAAPPKVSVEAEKLKGYYILEKQIKEEQVKPMAQQNYTDIKKALTAIANNKEAGKAARYSEFTIKQIERFELALAASKEVKLQDEQLQQIQNRIDKARAKKLAVIQDLGRFEAIGQFQTSLIYGPEAELIRYRITDDAGKTVCYALPTGSASKMDLSKFVGRKVGLVGTIEPHPQTAGALVKFTEIAKLK